MQEGLHQGCRDYLTNLEAMTAGNIVAGGVIGFGVDAATGAMNKYTEHNQIAMYEDPRCVGQ